MSVEFSRKCHTCGSSCQIWPVLEWWEVPSPIQIWNRKYILLWMWELQAPAHKLQKGYNEKLSYGSIPFMVFSIVEKKQYIMLTWGRENKWPCRSITVRHGCGSKMLSFWGIVSSHDPLQFLIPHSSLPYSSNCIPLCQWRLGLQAPYSGRVEKAEGQQPCRTLPGLHLSPAKCWVWWGAR